MNRLAGTIAENTSPVNMHLPRIAIIIGICARDGGKGVTFRISRNFYFKYYGLEARLFVPPHDCSPAG
jgi:hypothetical protein